MGGLTLWDLMVVVLPSWAVKGLMYWFALVLLVAPLLGLWTWIRSMALRGE